MKTQPNTILEFNGARGRIIKADNGYVTVQWDADCGGGTAHYRAHRIECDRNWRVIEGIADGQGRI
jgi:hypothetical protein